MKTALCVLILLAFYNGAIAQYHDMVASRNINTMLVDFANKFLTTKDYTAMMRYYKPIDTLWSTLNGKMDSSFTNPFVFYGTGYVPFNYHFEHEIFFDGSEKLNVHFRNKRAWEKVELEINFKGNHVSNATIRCATDMEQESSNSYSCTMDSLGLMEVSTQTLKEFEEKIKRILPYLQ